jgi:outer membrane immunogenic protein
MSALALATIATPAFAQGSDGTFSGVHIEAIGGGDRASGGGDNEIGALYGVSGGFDATTGGGLVIGGEVEGAMSTTNWCSGTTCVDAGRDLYGGGRIGKRIGDSGLIYFKAGYANARVKITSGGTTVFSENLDGVRGGIGLEGRKGKLLFRAEYRYTNYEQGFSRNQLVLGIGVHF